VYTYRLIINKEPSGKPYFFQYGNTKKIALAFSFNAASVTKAFDRDYRSNLGPGSFLYNLMKESIKRISLLHILYYQKQIKIKSIRMEVSSKNKSPEIIDLPESLVLYSMVDKKLIRPISQNWRKSDVLQNILQFQKSKDDMAKSVAALYSYLYSKTLRYETERFSYLWMSMNGMYNSMKPDNANDRAQMGNLLSAFDLGTETLTKDARDSVCHSVYIKMKDIEGMVSRESLAREHKGLEEYILQHIPVKKDNNKTYNLSAYGFLLTDFPYYLRCRLFHANRPMELFSFADDLEIKVLHMVNGLLEEFLDENLVRLFS